MTLAIGVQNVPEGLIVAVAFLTAGYPKRTALLVTLATGAVIGFGTLQLVQTAMPAALATFGVMVGVLSMLQIDAWLA